MNDTVECACGCAAPVETPDRKGRPRRFVSGHNNIRPLADQQCTLPGCYRPHYARTWCHMHYTRWLTHGSVKDRRPSLRDRLFSKLIIDQETGCLNWTGVVMQNGYGQISVGGRLCLVHRLTYERFVGPIPDGLEVDHLCRNKRCAAPAHLEAVTHQVNTARAYAPVSAVWQAGQQKARMDGESGG